MFVNSSHYSTIKSTPGLTSISMSSHGCAVGDDGNLLEATHIDFYNDPDDVVPISGPSSTGMAATSMAISSTLDGYITRTSPTVPPAVFIAGSRRSTRVPRLTEKAKLAMDSNCPETVAAGAKRRAEESLQRASTRRRFTGKTMTSTDQSGNEVSTEAEVDNYSESDSEEEGEREKTEAAFAATKALGDADRLVSGFHTILPFKY
jgi:hypothetical protein